MATTELVLAKLSHCRELAPTMRREDAAEVQASGGLTPLEALQDSLQLSTHAFTLMVDGKPAAMCGVVPYGEPRTLLGETAVAVCWLLTGELVNAHPKAFLRWCRPVVRQFRELYPVLLNAIDARYTAALRWARWLGFDVESDAQPFGVAGLPFHFICMRSADHV